MAFSDTLNAVGEFASETWDKLKDTSVKIVRKIASTGGDAVRDVVSGVSKVSPNMLPTATATLAELSYRGSQGSFSALTRDIVLIEKFYKISGTSAKKFGYPACKSRPIMDLSGFCLTQNAMFEISGTVAEEQALEELFNRGVILDWSGI